MILINTTFEIKHMQAAGNLAAELLRYLEPFVKPGITTLALNDLAETWTLNHGAKSGPLGYKGFTKSICTSINEVVCHGIPSGDRVLLDGDIINIDVSPVLKGFFGDTSKTLAVGKVSHDRELLIEVTRQCLDAGIAEVKPEASIRNVGKAIQNLATKHGLSVVRDFVGHGIGRTFHDAPTVYHYDEPSLDFKLLPGMIFTIEPMINRGTFEVKLLDDGWTAITKDGSDSAQFEHTVLVTESGVEILTI